MTSLPVCEAMDPHVRVRGIARHVLDTAVAMAHSCSAVVSLLLGAPSGVLRGLDLLAQRGLIAVFATPDRVQTVSVQGRGGVRRRTPPVGGAGVFEVVRLL